jgi:hypothetical protein
MYSYDESHRREDHQGLAFALQQPGTTDLPASGRPGKGAIFVMTRTLKRDLRKI